MSNTDVWPFGIDYWELFGICDLIIDDYKSNIKEYAAYIDKKYKDEEVSKKLIANLSSDFHMYHIPELIDLTKKSLISFPKPLKTLFITFQSIIFCFLINLIILYLIQVKLKIVLHYFQRSCLFY